MSSVFFDTNAWLPAVLSDGFNRRLVRAAEERVNIFISAELLDEVAEKLALKFGASWETIEQAMSLMKKSGRMSTEAVQPYAASPDPDDAILLAQAAAARCGLFVTNDKPLLALGAIDAMRIITPGEFARMLGVD